MKSISACYNYINLKIKGHITLLFLFMIAWLTPYKMNSQNIGIKTNALYWTTATANIGVEFITARKWSLEVTGGYNPWDFGNNQKMIKHWVAQSEIRYWLCEAFEGHFFGLHAQGGEFNISGINLPSFVFGSNSNNYRFQGFFVGLGVSYGYQWILSNRWSLEANIGFGYNYLNYEKFYLDECGSLVGKFTPSPGYFGPTKLGVSFIYIIK